MPVTTETPQRPVGPPKRLYKVHIKGALKAWVLHDDHHGLPIRVWTHLPLPLVKVSCLWRGHGWPPRAPHKMVPLDPQDDEK